MKQGIIYVVAGLILLGAVLFFAGQRPSAPSGDAQTDRTTREVALACDPQMAQGFHVHPVLEIIVNGESVILPPDIGIRQTCMTVLHTHTSDGIIHVESPEKRDFTLADFFAVWERPFSKDQLFEHTAGETHRIRVTVDGEEVDTYENTVLRDGERIVIYYEPI